MKKRLDIVLVEKSLVETRAKGQGLILAGQVLVNGERVDKAGAQVSEDDEITIKEVMPYVGRGAYKLEKALSEFQINPEDKICLDIGASTGGFTDLLLQKGAKKVYCIDVGYGQLHWKLRNDDRVVNFERENFRHFDVNKIKDPIDIVVMDVSFISIKKLLPKIIEVLTEGAQGARRRAQGVFLVKPQFEAGKENVGKGGVVRDEKVREAVLIDITQSVLLAGFENIQITESPIKGADGNVEYLLKADFTVS